MPCRSSKSNNRGTKELKEIAHQQKSKIEKGIRQRRFVSVTFGTLRLTGDPNSFKRIILVETMSSWTERDSLNWW